MPKLKKAPRPGASVRKGVAGEEASSGDLAVSVSASEARARFSELLHRAAFGGLRVRITVHNRTRAAIVSKEDLERLEELEDRLDAAAARRALAEPGEVPYEKVRRKLGL